MPRICTVCSHKKANEINQALAAGSSYYELATLYDVSEKALSRHTKNHLPAHLVKSKQAEEVVQADTIIERLKNLSTETMVIFQELKKSKDFDLALKAIARLEKQEELRARLLGELQQEGTVNIILAPQWVEIRAIILQTLAPWPEARLKLAAALQEVKPDAGSGK